MTLKSTLDAIAGMKTLRAAALASLCFAGAVHVRSAAADGGSAQASSAPRKMTLSGYVDGAAGTSLMSGHYEDVVGTLGAHGLPFKLDEVSASTNLCVAYIMTRRWDAAHRECDQAVRIASLEQWQWLPLDNSHNEHVAIAYSNRAVLEWLEDRPAIAAQDLAKAHTLAPAVEFVGRNLEKLGASVPLLGRRAPQPGSRGAAVAAR